MSSISSKSGSTDADTIPVGCSAVGAGPVPSLKTATLPPVRLIATPCFGSRASPGAENAAGEDRLSPQSTYKTPVSKFDPESLGEIRNLNPHQGVSPRSDALEPHPRDHCPPTRAGLGRFKRITSVSTGCVGSEGSSVAPARSRREGGLTPAARCVRPSPQASSRGQGEGNITFDIDHV